MNQFALLVETKMTGRQPAGEAVRGAVLSTRSYSAKTYAGARMRKPVSNTAGQQAVQAT